MLTRAKAALPDRSEGHAGRDVHKVLTHPGIAGILEVSQILKVERLCRPWKFSRFQHALC